MSNEFMQRFKDSLMGKSTLPEKNESIVVPEIQSMINDLITITDEAWGRYAFSRDPLNGKFDDEAKERLIHESNKCGIEYAHKMIRQYGNVSPKELAAKLRINVEYQQIPVGGGNVTFAQFVGPDQVTIFRDCVEKANNLIKDKNLNSVLENLDVEKTLLSHEIFHYIEEANKDEIFTMTEKVKLWDLKLFRNESRIFCLGEMAGMAFTKELLKMPYSPYVLDVFLVYPYSPEAAYGLYNEIKTYMV